MKEKGKQQLRKAGNGNVTFFSFFFSSAKMKKKGDVKTGGAGL